jgi:Mg/Co/Ni transporter MgtE
MWRVLRVADTTCDMDASRTPSRVLAAALGVAAVLGCVVVVLALIRLFSTTEPPFDEPEWALALLTVVLVATPIVAATVLVERAIGKLLGEGDEDRDNGKETT